VNVLTIVARTQADAILGWLIQVQLTLAAHAKVNSKEAFEATLALNLIGQIPAPINDADCKKRFDPIDSLIVVFRHEITLSNGLVAFLNRSFKATLADLNGTIVIDDTLEKIVRRVANNCVSEAWRNLAFPFVLTCRTFVCDWANAS
jgi:hypothetical protein